MSNTQKKNVPELRFPGFEGEYSLDIFGNLATPQVLSGMH
ncbi:hypothetical protein, partial [Staphylococcus aureus]